MRDGIDEIALASVEINVLDNPNQIENDSSEHERKHNRADAEQNPINIETAFIGGLQGTENVDQYPADRQPDEDYDHENC